MTKDELNKMTFREVMEYTKNMLISEGSLVIMFEKIALEMENLRNSIENIKE